MLKTQPGFKPLAVVLLLEAAALLSGCASSESGSAPVPVAVENFKDGKIRIKRGAQELALDLTQDISGCTGASYDGEINKVYDSADDFEIVDETEKESFTYLLLLASAPPNCNVQGQCGAADPDATLVWLKLAADLSLAGKQTYVLRACRADTSIVIPEEKQEDYNFRNLLAKDLTWAGDVLQVEIETLEFKNEFEKSYERLTYDRRNPDAGLQHEPVAPP
jgi:hypothetical protein